MSEKDRQRLHAALTAPTPEARGRAIRAFTNAIFKETRKRQAQGLCNECDQPVADHDSNDPLANTYCVAHAREIELEFLAFDQSRDARGDEG